MRSASSSVVPEEGRPVLGGTDRPPASPAGGRTPGCQARAQAACLREAIGVRDGAPARVKQCKYQQIVANDPRRQGKLDLLRDFSSAAREEMSALKY